jgi:hypothetical protein
MSMEHSVSTAASYNRFQDVQCFLFICLRVGENPYRWQSRGTRLVLHVKALAENNLHQVIALRLSGSESAHVGNKEANMSASRTGMRLYITGSSR